MLVHSRPIQKRKKVVRLLPEFQLQQCGGGEGVTIPRRKRKVKLIDSLPDPVKEAATTVDPVFDEIDNTVVEKLRSPFASRPLMQW